MRTEGLDGEESGKVVGAIVVHTAGTEVIVDLGPADGAPFLRLCLSKNEAHRLSANLRAVANGRDEEILLAEE